MKIHYIISHGVGRWVEFDRKGGDVLTISVTPGCTGSVTLGPLILSVKNGEVSLPCAALADGNYTPILECEAGVFPLDNFFKSGRSVALPENAYEVARDLITVCHELKTRNKKLEQRVKELENICKGHNIFNYERKEE